MGNVNTTNEVELNSARVQIPFFKKLLSQFKCYKSLKNLPLILILTLLYCPLMVFTWGYYKKDLYKQIQAIDAAPLGGMLNTAEKPGFPGYDFISGAWQKKVEEWLSRQIPFRAAMIRSHNQIYYSLFSRSYMMDNEVVIGENDYLFARDCLKKYYNSDRTVFTKEFFEKWIADLQNLNNFFEKRGQKFIYIITPSKVGYFPEHVPKSYNTIVGEKRPDYFLAINELKKTKGLHYIDASNIVNTAKNQYGNLLFPRSGLHWTLLGASLAVQEFLDVVEKSTGENLPKLLISYTVDKNPDDINKDVLSLSNILYPDTNFWVPTVDLKVDQLQNQHLKLAVIGDSFGIEFVKVLNKVSIFKKIDWYYYFKLNHLRFPGDDWWPEMHPIDVNNPNDYKDILAADIVVLEENEVMLNSNHFKLFLQTLLKNIPENNQGILN